MLKSSSQKIRHFPTLSKGCPKRTPHLITIGDFLPKVFVEIDVAPCYTIQDHLERESDEEKAINYAQITFGDDDLLLVATPHNRALFVVGYVKEQRVNRILLDEQLGAAITLRIVASDLHPDVLHKLQKIALYVASPSYESLFRWRGRFKLGKVDPLEEGRRPRRMWPNRSTWTLHYALWWDSAA
ncbi:hypothetical protein M9H77_30023 [Catharanthus roseus]|uniref:Uncharacterized protein n=1 Tax=Catharanthus roseus TaxID=4058 RepID=A0ACB9ZWZ2_CATRO|nr:hypothetical protein M9H77_30023 [Catharanthus roseus]